MLHNPKYEFLTPKNIYKDTNFVTVSFLGPKIWPYLHFGCHLGGHLGFPETLKGAKVASLSFGLGTC